MLILINFFIFQKLVLSKKKNSKYKLIFFLKLFMK
jgi:hypothetical protein